MRPAHRDVARVMRGAILAAGALLMLMAMTGCATSPSASFRIFSPSQAEALLSAMDKRFTVTHRDGRVSRPFEVALKDATGVTTHAGARIEFADVTEVTQLRERASVKNAAAAVLAAPLLVPCAVTSNDCFR